MTHWIRYSIIRIGLFALAFAGLFALGLDWWLAALLATVIAFTLSYIFFVKQRDQLARDLAQRAAHKQDLDPDAEAEDHAASEGDSKPQA
jgi:uncharacterized membrane protein YccF (DUF307 family)